MFLCCLNTLTRQPVVGSMLEILNKIIATLECVAVGLDSDSQRMVKPVKT